VPSAPKTGGRLSSHPRTLEPLLKTKMGGGGLKRKHRSPPIDRHNREKKGERKESPKWKVSSWRRGRKQGNGNRRSEEKRKKEQGNAGQNRTVPTRKTGDVEVTRESSFFQCQKYYVDHKEGGAQCQKQGGNQTLGTHPEIQMPPQDGQGKKDKLAPKARPLNGRTEIKSKLVRQTETPAEAHRHTNSLNKRREGRDGDDLFGVAPAKRPEWRCPGCEKSWTCGGGREARARARLNRRGARWEGGEKGGNSFQSKIAEGFWARRSLARCVAWKKQSRIKETIGRVCAVCRNAKFMAAR